MRMRIAEARTDLDEVGDENIECEGRLMILDDETIEDKKIKDKEKVEEEECDAERKNRVRKKCRTVAVWRVGVKSYLGNAHMEATHLKKGLPFGTGGATKTDEVSEKLQIGGHFQSKNFCCRFWTYRQGFLSIKWKKNATWFSENEGGGGEGQRPFGTSLKFFRFGDATHPLPDISCFSFLLLPFLHLS